ncbi:MAG: hypothetical protein U0271_11625 [Polyangiaceae bacterium]
MSVRAQRSAIILGVVMSVMGVARAASADGAAERFSVYERETIGDALDATETELDPEPEGKIIEGIVVRPLDVFERRDPLPYVIQDFLNIFHATTRPQLIEQQVLLHVGDRYEQRLVDESARNLRGIRQLSTVLIVAVRGSAPDKVKLLVIAKDIWSLRLNSDFRLANDQLEYLLLVPAEENLAGIHHTLAVRFELEPDVYTFGVLYKVPRIGGSWVSGAASANVLVNRESGEPEGTWGTFSYGQPLYSTRAEWSWIAAIAWRDEITRYFKGVEPLTFDADATPDVDDAIPIQFKTDLLSGRLAFVRSFGHAVKTDILFGAEASRATYRPLDLSGYAPEAAKEFVDRQLPLSDTRIYPYVGLASYSTKFKTYVDFETLGLQEDYRIGHDSYVKLYPVIAELGATRSFMGASVGASASAALGDGHLRVYSEGLLEAAPEKVYDASMTVGVRVVSPRTSVGRLVVDGAWQERFANYLNKRSTIGGESRLRGYPSGAYRGENVIAANLEFRSRPFDVYTIQLGATAFFDTGAAWDRGEHLALRPSVGAGFRLVFPQLERTVMRIDWALPLALDPSVGVTSIFPGRFLVTFEQAFAMPSVDPPQLGP